MTFTELDIAQLDLSTKDSFDTLSRPYHAPSQLFHLEREHQQQPYYIDNDNEASANQRLMNADIDLYSGLDTTPSSSLSLAAPDLDSISSWYPTSVPSALDGKGSPLQETRAVIRDNIPDRGRRGPSAVATKPAELPRQRSRYFLNRQSPNTSSPINIPSNPLARSAPSAADPMQRWRESPPEAEAASLSAIADALKKTPLRTRSSAGSLNNQRDSRATSVHSFGSGTSCSSASAASSVGSMRIQSASRGRVTKRVRAPAAPRKGNKDNGKEKRRFPCTFCCDSFKSRYDWARHEASLHLNLQGWQCAPFGGYFASPKTGRNHCAYCGELDPTPDHLESHQHGICREDNEAPVFRRKDHLIQHLRHVHHVQTPPSTIINTWKIEGPPVKSRCGICGTRLVTWEDRVEHLAQHFRKGATMDDWKGEHEFEPEIAAQITYSMPPYLIASESRAPVPFSATDPAARDHLAQIQQATQQGSSMWHRDLDGGDDSPENCVDGEGSPDSAPIDGFNLSPIPTGQSLTCGFGNPPSMMFPDLLALHLGRYAREQMRLGIMPTDAMFQQEARKLVFDSVDPWDQTIADNEDWLSCFHSRHLGNDQGNRDPTN